MFTDFTKTAFVQLTLNYTNAANMLYITQPALSRHIASMEEEIGVKLFSRDKHNVMLTSEGAVVAKEFQELIEKYDAVITNVSADSSDAIGKLRIGMLYYAITEYMAPIIKLFKNNFPNIELAVSSFQPHQAMQALLADGIDIGQVLHCNSPAYEQIRFHHIGREKLALLVSSKHPLANRTSVDLNDFSQDTFVLMAAETDFSDYTLALMAKNKLKISNTVYTEQVDTLPFTLQETGSGNSARTCRKYEKR